MHPKIQQAMSNISKTSRVLEKFWLVIASLATIFTIVIGIMDGFKGIQFFLVVCGLAWGVYLIRRGLRIRLEKIDEENKQGGKK